MNRPFLAIQAVGVAAEGAFLEDLQGLRGYRWILNRTKPLGAALAILASM